MLTILLTLVVSSLPSCLSLFRSICHQSLYPVPDDRVHYHIYSSARSPSRNAVCTSLTTRAQFSSSAAVSVRRSLCSLPHPSSLVAASLSFSPHLAAAIQTLRSSARILDGPPARLFRRRFTAHSIYASVGTPSTTTKGSIVTRMLTPGGISGCIV